MSYKMIVSFFSLLVAVAFLTEVTKGDKYPFLLHDPDFPVEVIVGPFGDDKWNLDDYKDTSSIKIPSSVINVTVKLQPMINVTNCQVAITLYYEKQPPEDGSSQHDVVLDTQVDYSNFYRLDVGVSARETIIRVYIEAQVRTSAGIDTKKRAFYTRILDLSPSEPMQLVCPPSEKEVGLRIYSYPPTNMPMDLCNEYTQNGTIPVRKWYFDDQSDTDKSYMERSQEFIDELIGNAKHRKEYYYEKTDSYLFSAMDKYPIKDKHVLIIGSTIPWYESICIAFEAASCTTLDYNKLRYHHPQIKTYTLSEFEQDSTARKKYDFIFSISSFEHDGLGRYGDPLNPHADIEAMSNLLRYTTSETKLLLAVPVGPDAVVWNAQRVYGPIRLPALIQAWDLVDSFGFKTEDFSAPFTLGHQPIFVLKAKVPSHTSSNSERHTEL